LEGDSASAADSSLVSHNMLALLTALTDDVARPLPRNLIYSDLSGTGSWVVRHAILVDEGIAVTNYRGSGVPR